MGPREAERLSGGVKGCAAPRSGAKLHVLPAKPEAEASGLDAAVRSGGMPHAKNRAFPCG
jgi:hypothetical protein